MSKERGEFGEKEGPVLGPADEPKRPDKPSKKDFDDDDVHRPSRYYDIDNGPLGDKKDRGQ